MSKSKNRAQKTKTALRVKEQIRERKKEKEGKKNREVAIAGIQPLIEKLVTTALYGHEKPPIPEKVKTTLLNRFNFFEQFTSNQRFTTFRCCA